MSPLPQHLCNFQNPPRNDGRPIPRMMSRQCQRNVAYTAHGRGVTFYDAGIEPFCYVQTSTEVSVLVCDLTTGSCSGSETQRTRNEPRVQALPHVLTAKRALA